MLGGRRKFPSSAEEGWVCGQESDRPSWPGGVAAPNKKKSRSFSSGAEGVVAQVPKIPLDLIHHPVRSIKGSFAMFLLMSRPPLLARRGERRGPPSVLLPPRLWRSAWSLAILLFI